MNLFSKKILSRINIYIFLVFILSIISVASSFYFQYKLDLPPCPMCIGQRVCMMAIALLSLLALPGVFFKKLKILVIILCFLNLIIISVGLYIAARQVYLQSLPPGDAPVCGPGFNVLIKVLPWQKVLMKILHGTGECAKVSWRFLSLSIAGWSVIIFSILWILNILGIIKQVKTV